MAPPLLYDVSRVDVSKPIIDRARIAEQLPHRGAMALVDGITFLDVKDQLIVGWKDVGSNEFWADGHFPGNPLFPGVLLVEAIAQISLICYKAVCAEIKGKLVLFGGIDQVRFRGAIRPRDRVILMSKMTDVSRRGAWSEAQAVVGGKLVFEGRVFAVVAS